MPRIPDYNQQISVSGTAIPGRDARETDFGGPGMQQLGAGLMQAGSDFARAGRALAEQAAREEVTDVYTRMSGLQAKWSKNLRDRELSADPADTEFAQRFQEDIKADLDTLSDRYSTPQGRQTYQKQAAELAAHFVEVSGVFQAKLAGVRAVENYNGLVNGFRSALLSNPDGLAHAEQQAFTAIDDPAGAYAGIPSTDREKLRHAALSELEKSAVQGYIQLDPAFALAKLHEAGGAFQNIDADARHTLIREAKTAIHAKEVEKEHFAANAIRARKLVDQQEQDRLLLQASDYKWSPDDIIQSQLLPENKIQFLNLAHARAKEAVEAPIRTVPSVELNLFNRIHLPAGNPRKITDPAAVYKAYEDKQLSWEDMNRLRREVYDAATPDGDRIGTRVKELMDGVKSSITKANPLLNKLDPEGDMQLYRYQFDLQKKIDEYRKAGKDPYDLLDPSKPDFFARAEVLSGYQKTIQESIKDVSERLRGHPGAAKAPDGGVSNGAQRKPGESVDQYLERMKKN